MVLEGPNCLGMVNHVDGVPLTFVETQCVTPAEGQAIGIVSQSGAMAAVLGTTLQARSLALSYSVSTGNEAGSTVEDYVGWLVDEPNTAVVAMIVEQFRDPRRFLAEAARVREAGKQIVLLHPGKSSVSALNAPDSPSTANSGRATAGQRTRFSAMSPSSSMVSARITPARCTLARISW